MIGESGDDHHKIERYLVDDDIKKKRALPSLTDLYDDMLDVIPEDQVPSAPSPHPQILWPIAYGISILLTICYTYQCMSCDPTDPIVKQQQIAKLKK